MKTFYEKQVENAIATLNTTDFCFSVQALTSRYITYNDATKEYTITDRQHNIYTTDNVGKAAEMVYKAIYNKPVCVSGKGTVDYTTDKGHKFELKSNRGQIKTAVFNGNMQTTVNNYIQQQQVDNYLLILPYDQSIICVKMDNNAFRILCELFGGYEQSSDRVRFCNFFSADNTLLLHTLLSYTVDCNSIGYIAFTKYVRNRKSRYNK